MPQKEDKKEIILGLDVSTTCIGCCIYLNDGSENGKIIELTHIVPKVSKKIKGIESLFLKKRIFDEEFLKKWKDFGITSVVIEEPLLRSNNVNTIGTLLRFNGMISDSVYNTLGIVPEYISCYDARKYSFPELMTIRKYNKKGEMYEISKIYSAIRKKDLVLFGSLPWDIDKKLVMWNKVSNIFPDIDWIYDTKDELKKENFDASDALVACLGYSHKQRYGELIFSLSNVVKEIDKVSFDVDYWDRRLTHKVTLEEQKKED